MAECVRRAVNRLNSFFSISSNIAGGSVGILLLHCSVRFGVVTVFSVIEV